MAISSLHNVGIIHGDIKPDNILVDSNLNVMLIDFGSACIIKGTKIPAEYADIKGRRSTTGTRGFMAPEYLKRLSRFSDMFSIGKTIAEAFTYSKKSIKMMELIDMLTEVDPTDRPNAEYALLLLSKMRSEQTGHKSTPPMPVNNKKQLDDQQPALSIKSGEESEMTMPSIVGTYTQWNESSMALEQNNVLLQKSNKELEQQMVTINNVYNKQMEELVAEEIPYNDIQSYMIGKKNGKRKIKDTIETILSNEENNKKRKIDDIIETALKKDKNKKKRLFSVVVPEIDANKKSRKRKALDVDTADDAVTVNVKKRTVKTGNRYFNRDGIN
ncbi:kinase-like domain-containing protein [Syncephalis fuscata]|nr:kinase-like domain-containing protein [Syncephalis fuscata]